MAPRHHTVVAIAAVLALLASVSSGQGGRRSDLRQQVAGLGLEPEEILRPLEVPPVMRSWVEERMLRGMPENLQLLRLLDLLQHGEEIEFSYRAGYTGTVREVFETGEYNCLSFSMLFVALSREVGLPAYYLKVDQIEDYEKEGDLVVMSRHITAGYGFVRDRTVLEFDVGPEISYNLAKPISDLDALALYYSNRGAELLREGRTAEALEKLEIAIVLGPESSQNWVNLGVAQRRTGNLSAAEEAYVKALEVEKGSSAAYHNMVTLLRLRGESDAAGEILARLDRRKNRNPFTYLALGDLSLDEERLDDARRFYRRALRLAKFEAETHAAMGQWAVAAGKLDKARDWLQKAAEIDPENQRVVVLRCQLTGDPTGPEPQSEPEVEEDREMAANIALFQ